MKAFFDDGTCTILAKSQIDWLLDDAVRQRAADIIILKKNHFKNAQGMISGSVIDKPRSLRETVHLFQMRPLSTIGLFSTRVK